MFTDDISLIHTEPTFRVCFSPQLLTNSVSLLEFIILSHLLVLRFFTGLLSFCPLQCHIHLQCIWSAYPLNQCVPNLITLQSETPAYRYIGSVKDTKMWTAWEGKNYSLYWVSCFLKAGWWAMTFWISLCGKRPEVETLRPTKKETKHHIQLKGKEETKETKVTYKRFH